MYFKNDVKLLSPKGLSYLGLLLQVDRWQSHQYQDAFGAAWLVKSLPCLRKRFAEKDLIDPQSRTTEGGANIGATTTNLTDADVVESSPILYKPVPSQLNPGLGGASQDISTFLSKPRVISQGLFQSNDSATNIGGAAFTPITFPKDILAAPIISLKVQGFLAIRATCVFTLQVNAQKFQQGRYIMGYVPYGGANTFGDKADVMYNMRRFTLMQCSQLPHVELDVACDTQATLRVPYVGAEYGYPIAGITSVSNEYGNVGKLFIRPYWPMSAGAALDDTCSWTLFAHLEDVELYGPTVPQSSSWKPTITEREQKSNGLGPVSSALSTMSNAAGILSSIQPISAFAGTVSWFLDLSSGVASALGYSKPLDANFPNTVRRMLLPNMQNADAADNSASLALVTNHGVSDVAYGGNEIDELSFAHIASIPSWYITFGWSTTNAYDTNVLAIGVNPFSYKIPVSDTTNAVQCFTPLAFIARQFNLWRGSIVYKFKVVKTSFHSGRLLVSFTPRDSRYPTPGISIDSTTYSHRTIVDIRDQSEFTVTVPFISTAPYLQQDESVGVLYVTVLDPLKGPATVSQTIYVLVEVAGGTDIDFAQPIGFSDQPYGPSAPQSSSWDPCSIDDSVVGGATVPGNDFSQYCIGEKVVSFRQLYKAYNPIFTYIGGGSSPSNVSIFPYKCEMVNYNAAETPKTSIPFYAPDWYTHMNAIFLLSRGSVRLKWIAPNNSATTIDSMTTSDFRKRLTLRQVLPSYSYSSWITAGDTDKQVCRGLCFQSTELQGALEFSVPMYNRYVSRVCSEQIITPSALQTSEQTHGPDSFVNIDALTEDATVYGLWARAGADDLTFSGFVSIPPYIVTILP